jgi:hypothetical protein
MTNMAAAAGHDDEEDRAMEVEEDKTMDNEEDGTDDEGLETQLCLKPQVCFFI